MPATTRSTTPNPASLGQRIATLRRANGWSQRRLAEAAGVSHGYIALLELGRLPSPSKFRLDAIARALNLKTADALTAAQTPPTDETSQSLPAQAPTPPRPRPIRAAQPPGSPRS